MSDGLDTSSLARPPQKVERQRSPEVKVEDMEDLDLHLDDLFSSVGSIGDIDHVLDLRGVNLLVFGGDQHGGHSNQLQLFPGHSPVTYLDLQKPENKVLIILVSERRETT